MSATAATAIHDSDIINYQGEKVGTCSLDSRVFAVKVNEALLWEQVKAQRACARRGTHATKTRAMVSGGGIKPYKQKGTGRARQGSIRAPNHVGGGVVFGPHPRDYSYHLPKSARRAALRSALSQQAYAGKVMLLDDFPLTKPATKVMQKLLDRLGEIRVLIVGSEQPILNYSTRNLPRAKYLDVAGLNVFDVMKYALLIICQPALPLVVQRALPSRDLKSTDEET